MLSFVLVLYSMAEPQRKQLKIGYITKLLTKEVVHTGSTRIVSLYEP